ncbi:ComF family protein [Streptococcus sp. zg-JUN1979]|uniref:ComF family protein n=1 Tax=Streptococcus sp. zg-JUN1979 TaxID=3391450 RepID=UPI0039A463F1
MDCLFCNTHYDNQVRFSDIFFLTPLKQSICKECKAGFEAIDERHCPRCFKAHHQGVCSDCKAWEKEGYLVNHKTLYRYNSQMKAYFSRFKFQGDYLLASLFQEEIKQALKAYKGYTIVAIPLGKKRYEERQFNQVLALLEGSGYRHQELLGKHDSQKQSSKGKKSV